MEMIFENGGGGCFEDESVGGVGYVMLKLSGTGILGIVVFVCASVSVGFYK